MAKLEGSLQKWLLILFVFVNVYMIYYVVGVFFTLKYSYISLKGPVFSLAGYWSTNQKQMFSVDMVQLQYDKIILDKSY